MSSFGRVSVVIPTFNYGRFIVDAVESVLRQTFRGSVELIVVDDGSSDDTQERLRPYAGRIRSIVQENRGVSVARNRGILEATGEWIALLDADDQWHPQTLEMFSRVVTAHDLDVVSALIVYDVLELPERLEANPPVEMVTFEGVTAHVPLPPSATMIRRQALIEAGLFDETLLGPEDRAMWMRLAMTKRIGRAMSEAVFYRLHPKQITRNPGRMLENYRRMLAKFFQQFPERAHCARFAYSYMHVDAGIAFIELNQRVRAARHLLTSLWLHPWEPATSDHHSTSKRLKLLTRALLGERLFQALLGSLRRETWLPIAESKRSG